jgi:hypothetical protein
MDLNDRSIANPDNQFHSRPVEAVDTIVASVANREELDCWRSKKALR